LRRRSLSPKRSLGVSVGTDNDATKAEHASDERQTVTVIRKVTATDTLPKPRHDRMRDAALRKRRLADVPGCLLLGQSRRMSGECRPAIRWPFLANVRRQTVGMRTVSKREAGSERRCCHARQKDRYPGDYGHSDLFHHELNCGLTERDAFQIHCLRRISMPRSFP